MGGGGGGVDGFRNLLAHLGPASQTWLEDMRANTFTYTKENIDILADSVSDELQGKNVRELEQRRDTSLVRYIQV
jgi:3-hydroxyacyl-CoA dehydrogenase